uniref:Uncharacterized protein n=1 Tax=Oryza barthii TaxID=65489 RepID=A0A0D3G8B4_9ORYZ
MAVADRCPGNGGGGWLRRRWMDAAEMVAGDGCGGAGVRRWMRRWWRRRRPEMDAALRRRWEMDAALRRRWEMDEVATASGDGCGDGGGDNAQRWMRRSASGDGCGGDNVWRWMQQQEMDAAATATVSGDGCDGDRRWMRRRQRREMDAVAMVGPCCCDAGGEG